MFGSNSISIPTSFAQEHRSLRMSAETARPQPTGQCHYQLHSPVMNSQICACQIYQHNRSAPGNVCDCGHSACYHGATANDRLPASVQGPKLDLLERVQKLENMVTTERTTRNSLMAQERANWEREILILREALAPFYKNEEDMQRKLEELERRIDGSSGVRSQNRPVAIQTAGGANNLPVGFTETSVAAGQLEEDQHRSSSRSTSNPSGDDVPGLTSGDDRSSVSSFSRHHTPSDAAITLEAESPRSSGVLDLINCPRPVVPSYTMPRRTTPTIVAEEPRSSGFLGTGFRDHAKVKAPRRSRDTIRSSSPRRVTGGLVASQGKSLLATAGGRIVSPRILSSVDGRIDRVLLSSQTAKRRKDHGSHSLALDVLADVSAARPLMS